MPLPFTLRPLLVVLGLCALPLALSPAAAWAQPGCLECEEGGGPGGPNSGPPDVYIEQTQTVYSGLAPGQVLEVSVLVCADGAVGGAAWIRGDTALDFQWEAPSVHVLCGQRVATRGAGRVTLVPGANAFRVQACAAHFTCSEDVRVFRYTWLTRGIAVTPDEAVAVVPPGVQAQQVFEVHNAGMVAVDVGLTATCSASLGSCTAPPTALAVQPGTSRSVTVAYTPGGAGTVGDIRLRARVVSDTTIHDDATVQVSVPTADGAPLALVTSVSSLNTARPTPSLCLMLPAGPGAGWSCGDLRLAHAAPALRTLDRVRQPVLVYASAHAEPAPVVQIQAGLQAGSRSPDSVRVVLHVGNAVVARRTYAGGEWAGIAKRRMAVGFETDLQTGFYPYVVEIWSHYGTSAPKKEERGILGIVNRRHSPYGAGWWVAGVEELVQITSDSVTWVGGDGSMRRYRALVGEPGRFVVASVTHPDTLVRDGDGSYRRLLPNRVHVGFDAFGRHRMTVTPTGTTVFHYTATGELAHVEVPALTGVVWSHAFLYEPVAGEGVPRLARILRVRDRTGQFSDDAANSLRVGYALGGRRITHLTDPDGEGVSFGYEDAQAPARVTRRTDRMQVPTTYQYGPGGKLVRTSTPLQDAAPVVHRYEPAETRGWSRSVARVETHYVGPGAESRPVRFTVNPFGAPLSITNVEGRTTYLRYHPDFAGLPVRVQQVDGRISGAVYDARGRLSASIDSSAWVTVNNVRRYATTQYEYGDANWPHRPTRIVAPEGEETRIGYDPVHGGRLWVSDARGAPAATHFSYSGNGRVVTGVLTPENTVRPEQPWAQFSYDALGNVSETATPLGTSTFFLKDALGRDTLVISPIDHPTAGMRALQRIEYDAMDRVRTTRSTGPPVSYLRHRPNQPSETMSAPAQELIVRNAYDGEGRLILVSRRAIPDSAGIDSVVTRWERDGLGRVVSEVAPDGKRDRTLYDAEGRVAGYVSRRQLLTTLRYDAMGRLVERVTPPVTYARSVQQMAHPQEPAWVFPLYQQEAGGHFGTTLNLSAGVTIPADTARFTYDAAGRLRTADNRDARISRRYDAAGRLAADTLRIRAYAGNTFPHVYGLRYEYDLNGRRTTLHHPENLFPGSTHGAHATEWRYNALGELEQVLHAATGGGASFSYDAEGRLRVVESPARQETWYDADGRVESRLDGIPGVGLLRYETYEYDARGKITGVEDRNNADEVVRASWNAYTGLGMLVWSGTRDYTGRGSFMEETMMHDPHGNVRGFRRASVVGQALVGENLDEGEDQRYERLTGRLTATLAVPSFSTEPYAVSYYDAAGNQFFRGQNRSVLTPYPFPVGPRTGPLGGGASANAMLLDRTFSYFGADERLRVLDRRTCLMVEDRCREATPAQDERSSFEEHRYDALGRRVLLHARQDPEAFCFTCRSQVVRTVWDGHQVLHEISARPTGSAMEQDVPSMLDSFMGAKHYGRVMYVHGGALDYPVTVVRTEYSDSLPGAALIFPLSNHKGQYDMGVGVGHCAVIQGRTYRLAEPIGEPRVGSDTAIDMRDFTHPMAYCVEVDWPGKKSFSTGYRRPTWGNAAPWMGSLLYHGRDPSAQMYRRNRFYDPQTGRFTQEDPIGIAGGLNVYGYANGDPISYSDPYGLSAQGTCLLSIEFCLAFGNLLVRGLAAAAGRPVSETAFIIGNPATAWRARRIVNQAQSQTLRLVATGRLPGGTRGMHNGPGDAVRHAAASCQMVRDLGTQTAETIGNNHEEGSPEGERRMDQHNNSVGRGLASQRGTCMDNAVGAWDAGSLETLGSYAPAVPGLFQLGH